MSNEQTQIIVTELLRIGLIAIRNLSNLTQRKRSSEINLMLVEWAELCHSVPALLLGGCKCDSVSGFVEGHGASFIRNYPLKNAADFKQVCGLLHELSALVQRSVTTGSKN